jgi:SAM-dependent methyltransferase
MHRATVFGEIAATYDRSRPAYPSAMYDDLVVETGLVTDASVLEIGCGTGLATVELVRRGLDVEAIDPDSRMLQVARENLAGERVRFTEARFEDFRGPHRYWELVFAAGSWHWVDANVGLSLAASLLSDDGSLAVCWNLPRPEDRPRPPGLDAAYQALAPELADVASQVKNRTQEHRYEAIAASELFSEPTPFSYQWTQTLSTAQYCDLLSTHSDHRMLGPQRLTTLLAAVREAIDHSGGIIRLGYETVLYVAHKRV